MYLVRFLVLLGLIQALISCKLEVTNSTQGQVRTDSGTYRCAAGETCVIDVVDTFFSETFRAVPKSAYTFTAWRTRPDSFCGGSTKPCRLSTAGLLDTPLMSLLESDRVYYLEPVFGRPDTWRQRAETSTAGVFHGACVVGGELYAIGLGWGDPGAMHGQVEAYDPVSDSWEPRASLPVPRSIVEVSTFKRKCYAIGGAAQQTALADVHEYDPQTDTWVSRTPMPEPRAVGGSAVVNGKIYVMGGSDTAFWNGTPGAAVLIYDPKKDRWSKGADMPTPRLGLGVAAVGGLIYAVGGSNHGLGIFSSRIVERYDPAKDQWKRVADLPEERDFLSAVALNGRLYAVGGLINPRDSFVADAPSSKSIYRYSPQDDSWERLADMSDARYRPAVATLDGQLYVVGGRPVRESASLNTTEEYTP